MGNKKISVVYAFLIASLISLVGIITSYPQVEGFTPKFGLGVAFLLLLLLLLSIILEIAVPDVYEDDDEDANQKKNEKR